MLAIKTQCNLRNAEDYFKAHLRHGDYYNQDNEVLGQWIGQGAERLGLTGTVEQEDFLRLCRNEHPATRLRLTQRLKTTRQEMGADGAFRDVANRRVLFDFTFSPPKSVSIQAFIADDQRILEAHNRAVRIAVGELEQFAGTRFHVGLDTSERITANVVCALFRHETSRALDPHLHTHCIVFNATYDAMENRWKALSNYEMLQARKFVENVYYHELVRDLRVFGYDIENKPRGDFEIAGVPTELCDRFSKRHQQIDKSIRELLHRKPELAKGNLNDLRSQIAQTERARKENLSLAQLQKLWNNQMTNDEKNTVLEVALKPARPAQYERTATDAIQWAEQHLFDRRSVVKEHELWSGALSFARGDNLSVTAIKGITAQRDYIRNEDEPGRVTTREILDRELEIVRLAREGRKQFKPFNLNHRPSAELKDDQRRAVEKILRSRDFVSLFSGGAGTGKSHTLREIGNALKGRAYPVIVIAPQRQQALDLEKQFGHAQTVSEFLAKHEMANGTVVVVDEAGQIGGKQMLELLTFVARHKGRFILSGDTRQHGAVEASDALRAIEKYSGLEPARLTQIRRQNPKLGATKSERKRIKEYRKAVREAQKGNYDASFERLDNLGAIIECRTTADQRDLLVAEYIRLARVRQSTVVVAQTWNEIHQVNERIRQWMQAVGLIGKKDVIISALERIDLTDAQKRDARFYEADSVVAFTRRTGGFKKGEHGKVLAVTATHLLVETENHAGHIAFHDLDRLTVWCPKALAVARDDRLQLKANCAHEDGAEFVNGELVTVKKVDPSGRIHLQDGRILPKNYREFIRGYAVTSYASQGKTVEHVLFSDSAVKAATNGQQWLVTISRGKRSVKIFTANKEQLRENISRWGNRQLAIELSEKNSYTQPPRISAGRRRLTENAETSRNTQSQGLRV